VIVAAYNAEAYIDDAVESILQQTLQDFEIIVVNDGSTDGTRTRLETYETDPRVTVIDQPNAGPAGARNRGFQASSGRFIAIFDADDRCNPHRLSRQVDHLRSRPDLDLVGSYAQVISPDGSPLEVLRVPTTHSEIASRIENSMQFIHPTIMCRREVFESLGGYNEECRSSEDYEFLRRVVQEYQVGNIPEVLCDYRIHAESETFRRLEQQKFWGLLTHHGSNSTDKSTDQLLAQIDDQELSIDTLADLGVPRGKIATTLITSYKRRVRLLVSFGNLHGAADFLKKAKDLVTQEKLGKHQRAELALYEVLVNACNRATFCDGPMTELLTAARTSPTGVLNACREWCKFGLHQLYIRIFHTT